MDNEVAQSRRVADAVRRVNEVTTELDWREPSLLTEEYPALENLRLVLIAAEAAHAYQHAHADIDHELHVLAHGYESGIAWNRVYDKATAAVLPFNIAYADYHNTVLVLVGLN